LKRLEGRVATITGGGSGLGKATAIRFASEGAHVVIADMDEKSGQAVATEVNGTFIKCNVADKASVDNFFAEVFKNLTTEIEAWDKVQLVNLTSVYLCCKAVLPYMLKAKKGSIINTASFVATLAAATSQIAYTASKGGVLAMTRELGVQFAREGVRVNALSPGPVNTPLLQELFAKDKERAQRRLVHIPMGRFGEASEIAAAVAFLASDDSSFITASNFLVDGGITGAYVTPL